jgi:hypothetical protein
MQSADRLRAIIVPVGLVLLLSGCVSSIHPFYDEKDVVFDSALLGTWTSIDKMLWSFRSQTSATARIV